MQILQERAQALIEQRQVLTQRPEVVSVMIPPAEGERDASSPGLDQAAGDEEMFHQLRTAVIAVARIALAVAGAHLRVFAFDIQRFEQPARGQNAEGLL